MSKEPVKVVVVMPIGPLGSNNRLEYMLDTLSSIVYYTVPERRIIVQDNSYPVPLGDKLKAAFPEIIVIRTPENYGLYGGLYKAESLALIHAHTAFDFQVLIRMDADALFIDKGLEDAAIQYFAEHPSVGQIGNYLTEGEGIEWSRKQILQETSLLGWIQDRRRHTLLTRLVRKAQTHDYKIGESILGGVSIFSPVFVDKLVQEFLLLREEIRRAKLQEDHIFSLLCKAVGLDLGDFGSAPYPMAVAWKGLPSSPQDLVRGGKKIIHSTRFWNGMNEDQIRSYFRERRA